MEDLDQMLPSEYGKPAAEFLTWCLCHIHNSGKLFTLIKLFYINFSLYRAAQHIQNHFVMNGRMNGMEKKHNIQFVKQSWLLCPSGQGSSRNMFLAH